eukprot:jgi/Psemu1/283423/fgenesh1_pg.27_\
MGSRSRLNNNCSRAWSVARLVPAALVWWSLQSVLVVDGGSVRINQDEEEQRQRQRQQREQQQQREQRKRQEQRQEQEQPEGQKETVDYRLWKPAKIASVVNEWKETYPDLIAVTTSQEAYGLPAAGGPWDCPFYEKGDGCPNYFFTIQDFVAHPPGSPSSSDLPEVFWSGCLHGNERVGPTSVMEASALLLESAHCEGLPRSSGSSPSSSSSSHDRDADINEARACREALRNKGIDDVHRKWLARLVTTRRIVVVPTTNALGYYRNERTEGGIDPNRDFPYDLEDYSLCMQTIAGRTANEIYRDHMFQLALTFHGGMEVVAYEWGAPSWLGHLSPDNEAQSQIGAAYSRYGGGWHTSGPYNYGTMNDLVYYVRGGMEDWAYAGSWTPDKALPCRPRQFGGYPEEKTIYNNSTLRVFNMLVETSNEKEPSMDLGYSLDVLNRDTVANGHVSRNIRLSLLAVDAVQPYVGIVGVNKLALTDDVVPMRKPEPNSCLETNAVMVAENAKTVDIEWTVGGAMTIDNTELWYAKWDDVLAAGNGGGNGNGSDNDGDDACWTQPENTDLLRRVEAASASSGFGFFSTQGSQPPPEESATGIRMTNGPLFRATIPLDDFQKGDKVMVLASARVDQSWKNKSENTQPDLPPQSHIVNARTDPDYHHESNGKHIRGRLDWFSVPVTIVIGEFQDSVGKRGEDAVDAVEMHPRFVDTRGINNKGGVKPNSAHQQQEKHQQKSPRRWSLAWQTLLEIGLVVSLSGCCIRLWCNNRGGARNFPLLL